MSTTQRMYLISQLEAHFGRMLRSDILRTYESEKNYLDGMDETEFTRPVAYKRYVNWLEQHVELAREGAEIVEAARQCPDDMLDVFVRWQTMPNWRKAMTDAGMVFDPSTLRWSES